MSILSSTIRALPWDFNPDAVTEDGTTPQPREDDEEDRRRNGSDEDIRNREADDEEDRRRDWGFDPPGVGGNRL